MTTVEVVIEVAGQNRLVGQAYFTRGRRGEISTTFIYDPSYISEDGTNIDPALVLDPGVQYQAGLLRAFADSAPDRWGRNLLNKAERLRARDEGRVPRRLDDLDYLLGVSDDTRQGALRFRLTGSDVFVGPPSRVPKLVSLPKLLRASDELASDGEYATAVKQLLETGTTGLGGARPKASVRFDDGSLAIAKFPHSSDQWDVMAWEATTLDLIGSVGIQTPIHQLTRIGERSVLLLRRFDRGAQGQRLGYVSALTALGASDGDHLDYADIGEAVRDLSRSPKHDLHELFDRVVVNVALGNTDDHLRNHGFLLEEGVWQLSPAFDVNPNPDLSQARATSIAGADMYPDEIDGLLALAEDFGLMDSEARERMGRIAATLTSWRTRAKANGIREREITMMADSIIPRLEMVSAAGGL